MIGIIGSGNVGANAAFFMAEKAVDHVVLYDVADGLPVGKALDMMEAAPVRGYRTRIQGTNVLDDVARADVIVVAAGTVRRPGTKREDLFGQNRDVVADIASSLRDVDAKVIIVTEPVDVMTTFFVRKSGLPAERVMGLGGLLDATRLRYMIAEELQVAMDNVAATVIGRHADSMIPLAGYTCVSGVPVTQLLEESKLEELFERTRNAGDLIVQMAQRASSYYGPSAAVADIAEAIVRDEGRIMPVSVMFTGEYGVSGVAMSLPSVIGKNGIEQTLKPRLTDEQTKILVDSAAELEKILAE